jgi:hypothetical protein
LIDFKNYLFFVTKPLLHIIFKQQQQKVSLKFASLKMEKRKAYFEHCICWILINNFLVSESKALWMDLK